MGAVVETLCHVALLCAAGPVGAVAGAEIGVPQASVFCAAGPEGVAEERGVPQASNLSAKRWVWAAGPDGALIGAFALWLIVDAATDTEDSRRIACEAGVGAATVAEVGVLSQSISLLTLLTTGPGADAG